eukprot:15460861-Alexandrium_andersonii.AAC.1
MHCCAATSTSESATNGRVMAKTGATADSKSDMSTPGPERASIRKGAAHSFSKRVAAFTRGAAG